jgi:hypothetical protein
MSDKNVTPEENEKRGRDLLVRIYDSLYKVFTAAPEGTDRSPDAESRPYFTLANPGIAINPADFAGGVDFKTPNGDVTKTLAFTQLVDKVPRLSPAYIPGEDTVGVLYEQFLKAAEIDAAPEPTQRQREEYVKAVQLLSRPVSQEVVASAPGTGDKDTDVQRYATEWLDDSELYVRYQAAQTRYADVLGQWDMARLGEGDWAKSLARIENEMRQASANLSKLGRAGIETALRVRDDFGKNGPALLIGDAARNLDRYKLPNRLGERYLPVFALPSNWMADNDGVDGGWVSMSIDAKSDFEDRNSDIHKVKGQAEAGIKNLFTVSGNANVDIDKLVLKTDVRTLKFGFKFMRVELRRPWLSTALLGLEGVNMRGVKRGGYSDGKRNSTKTQQRMPLITTAMIVAKDIRIQGAWEQDDVDSFSAVIGAAGKFGLGPISVKVPLELNIEGNYEGKKEWLRRQFNKTNTELKVDGMQIIGFINQVVPLSPAAGDEEAPK